MTWIWLILYCNFDLISCEYLKTCCKEGEIFSQESFMYACTKAQVAISYPTVYLRGIEVQTFVPITECQSKKFLSSPSNVLEFIDNKAISFPLSKDSCLGYYEGNWRISKCKKILELQKCCNTGYVLNTKTDECEKSHLNTDVTIPVVIQGIDMTGEIRF